MAPKKAPAFYTDADDMDPYRVKANDLILTPLGLTATVLGVKYAKKDDPETSSLWVEHRCEYQSPIEEQYFEDHKPCPKGASIWRDVIKLDKILQEDEEERSLVQELNRQYQEQLAAEEAKKTKKKPADDEVAAAASSSSTAEQVPEQQPVLV